MHTFASRLETSIPAHRACTTSTSDSPSAPRRWSGVRPGEGRKIESLTLVLEGNTPRFPGAPSATMLTYRLASTTEQFGVRPGRTSPSSPPAHGRTSPCATAPTRESSLATVSLRRRVLAADQRECRQGPLPSGHGLRRPGSDRLLVSARP